MAASTEISNPDFAVGAGVSESMASRLLNGKRLPSISVMNQIEKSFGIDIASQTAAYAKGADAYGKLLRAELARTK